MGLESATHLNDLDETWPTGLDPTNKGDDHIRMIKDVLKRVFPGAALAGFAVPITASEAELNKMDGVTSTTAELNILDGVTSTAAELNILDGVTSTAAELNILDGVVATTAELNHTTGATSNLQTQIDGNDTDIALRVLKAGDTMTGQLAGITPVSAQDLTRKDYVDLRVLRSGDTMTGQLSGITPSAAANLTRKDYVDNADALLVLKAGDTLTGNLNGITPISDPHLTRKDYVDDADTILQANIDAIHDDFVAGTKALFYQNAAPTGWTIDQAVDEHSLRFTKGSGAGGQAGGALGGTDNFSTVFGLTATDGHSLTSAENGPHTHGISIKFNTPGANGAATFLNGQQHSVVQTVSSGSGTAHTHNIDLRVKWASCIVATKN